MMRERFGKLLSEGIRSVSGRQGQAINDVEQKLADELGYTHHTVQRWKRGNVPKHNDHVAFLVRYCVRNGRVDRAWANSILTQAQYPERETLLQELFAVQLLPGEAPRIYQNLPPRYGEFLGREADLSRTIEGLDSRWPLISIEGMGGVGKTTLALEAAQLCLAEPERLLTRPFQAVIWVSAKDRPEQKKWLNEVLDIIARVLDYRYITQLELEPKMREVDNLLRAQPVLLMVDNFETIEDPDLEQWLQRIPEPSKALMTTRHRQMRAVWDIHLTGLDEPEALTLIRRHIQRLGLRHLESVEDKVLLPLTQITEGNPYAIEMALGYIKRGMASLAEVVDHLHEASVTVNNIFDYLFTHAWKLLDEDARHLLMASAFFVDSVSKEALAVVADLQGYRLDTALGHLSDLSLLSNDGPSSRFNIHPLTRSFANNKLNAFLEWKHTARERWIAWFINFTEQYETRDWLGHVEVSQEQKNIFAAISWALQNQHPTAPLLVKQIWYYLYIRGFWEEGEAFTRQAIKHLKQRDPISLYYWLVSHLGWLIHEKDRPKEALHHLLKVKDEIIASGHLDLLRETNVLNYLAQIFLFEGNYKKAESYERRFIDMAQVSGDRHGVLVAKYYLALISLKKENFHEAECLYNDLIDEGKNIGYERVEGYSAYRLAEAQLGLGKINDAEYWLRYAHDLAERWQEPLLLAHILYGYAKMKQLENKSLIAMEFARKSYDIYRRLGPSLKSTISLTSLIEQLEQEIEFDKF